MNDVMMVEGEAKECDEKDLVDAIKIAHEAIKVQITAQLELAKKVGGIALTQREVVPEEVDEDLYNTIKAAVKSDILDICNAALSKHDRKGRLDEISVNLIEKLKADKGEEYMAENGGKTAAYFDKIKKNTIREFVLDTSKRLDGRKLDEVRPIWTEVDYLPSAHGSAIFNRGETQSLTSLTLGTKLDEQMIDKAVELTHDKFLLHYNFPGFSVGEVKPQRGPGRREVGHANLAARSLKQVMPADNPYVIRLVSDILESNGSSSMATVCAGSLALMDGGIKIKDHVAGIAMGMIAEEGRLAILSDILGDEDALGDMDFKVTGTTKGICGCQMDIKINGLPYEQLEKALAQAREGRLHIISKMNETLQTANADLKPHAPRLVEIIIEKSFIGAVIGPGGSIIQDLQAKTGTVITIEEKDGKGYVNISSNDKNGIDAAVAKIRQISFAPAIGDEFESEVKEILAFGAVVDFAGKQGLLHISEISHNRVANVEDVLKVGDKIKIKLLDVDKKTGKFKLSAKALIPRPGQQERNDR